MAAIKGYTPITELLMLGFDIMYESDGPGEKLALVTYRKSFRSCSLLVNHYFRLKRGAVYRGTLYKGEKVNTDRLYTLLSKVTRSMKRIEEDEDV